MSRPVRARGLKLFSERKKYWYDGVSRPVRARGLKLKQNTVTQICNTSRPVRARGLKLAGAGALVSPTNPSRPVRARGLKHHFYWDSALYIIRRAPCGRVD